MVLPKYEPNFQSLTTDQAVYLAQHMLPLAADEASTLTGPDLYQIANEMQMDQADVVMTLATDATPVGVQVVEALVGRPIVRKRASEPRTSRGPRRSVSVSRSDPRVITYVQEHNPKKEGSASWARFALYRAGMTVDEFLRAGGTIGDIKWDAERDFIRLGAPGSVVPTEDDADDEAARAAGVATAQELSDEDPMGDHHGRNE